MKIFSILAIYYPSHDELKVFERVNSGWTQKGLTIDAVMGYPNNSATFPNLRGLDYLDITPSGTTIAISLPYQSGRVKVYSFKNNEWTQDGSDITIIDINSSWQERFAPTVALSDDGKKVATIGIGEYQFGKGSIFMFTT